MPRVTRGISMDLDLPLWCWNRRFRLVRVNALIALSIHGRNDVEVGLTGLHGVVRERRSGFVAVNDVVRTARARTAIDVIARHRGRAG